MEQNIFHWNETIRKMMENKKMTIAEQVGNLLNNDGQCWQSDDGRDFEDIIEHHEAVTEVRGDLTRYYFADGSAIVASPGGWDIEGTEPFSFEGA